MILKCIVYEKAIFSYRVRLPKILEISFEIKSENKIISQTVNLNIYLRFRI